MLRVLHSSDLHGKYKRLLKGMKDADFQVWVDTGDFYDNIGRTNKTNYRIIPEMERVQQSRWWGWKMLGSRMAEWLDGRPAIIVPGNHDFINLHHYLKRAGADSHLVTPKGVEVAGLRWAGFRNVLHMVDEWEGETFEPDFDQIVAETMASDPDVLVTHSPPSGILNPQECDYGIRAVTHHLSYLPHRVRWHFFGHDHDGGGQQIEQLGIRFINGALHTLIHEVGEPRE